MNVFCQQKIEKSGPHHTTRRASRPVIRNFYIIDDSIKIVSITSMEQRDKAY